MIKTTGIQGKSKVKYPKSRKSQTIANINKIVARTGNLFFILLKRTRVL